MLGVKPAWHFILIAEARDGEDVAFYGI